MADLFYLNLWFPSFETVQILPRLHSVLKQFPASKECPGVGFAAIRPVSWNEPTLLEESFDYRTDVETALHLFADHLNEDCAYEVEMAWDVWMPVVEGELDPQWRRVPQTVRITAHGAGFEDGDYRENGHIQIEFGLDTPYLYEEGDFTPETEERIKVNIQQLVQFTHDLEANCGITGRVLWSESGETLAQKLIARLQKVQ